MSLFWSLAAPPPSDLPLSNKSFNNKGFTIAALNSGVALALAARPSCGAAR